MAVHDENQKHSILPSEQPSLSALRLNKPSRLTLEQKRQKSNGQRKHVIKIRVDQMLKYAVMNERRVTLTPIVK
jgi:hypothetical protein